MYKNLIIESFKLMEAKSGYKLPYQIAQELSKYIGRQGTDKITSESLVGYLRKSKRDKEFTIKPFVRDILLEFLDFQNLEDFNRAYPQKPNFESSFKAFIKNPWSRWVLFILVLLFVGLSSYNYALRERWMIWIDTEYKEVPFKPEKYGLENLKIYKEERITRFKRIEPDCSYEFFNSDGTPRVWYGKNKDGNYQWFTDLAKHPETGKSLKEITDHMIKTHICK